MYRKLLLLLALTAGTTLALTGASYLNSDGSFVQVFTTSNPLERPAPSAVDEYPQPIFFEDFDSDLTLPTANWLTEDLTAPSWHKDDYSAFLGNSWWVGDTVIMGYDDFTLQFLVSPTINLSAAVNPMLEFKAKWAVEVPGGGIAFPYDGLDGVNVWASNNDGQTWNPLPIQPPNAYTSQHLGSFGYTWGSLGFGDNVPGWTGYSGGQSPGQWIHATASMTGYNGTEVRIRFALASDESLATREIPELTGFFVDNINLHDATQSYLLNDADLSISPHDMEAVSGTGTAGNFWNLEYLALGAPSGDSLMRFAGSPAGYPINVMIKNALVSPAIDLRNYSADTVRLVCDFKLRGTMNVNEPQTTLPNIDFWTVQVSPDSGLHWYYFSNPWSSGETNINKIALPLTFQSFSAWHGDYIDLSSYAGEVVFIRILFITDGDAYVGEGMFVDDFLVGYLRLDAYNLASENLWFPMPTSAYFSALQGTVEVHNVGINPISNIPVYWKYSSNPALQLLPAPSLDPGASATLPITLSNPTPGTLTNVHAYTAYGQDTSTYNDTSYAGSIEITPANLLELGYDNRQYTYLPNYNYFNFAAGTGIIVKFTPTADGVTIPLDATELKALFHTTGLIRVHVFQAGTATTPGPEVAQFETNVTATYPNWQTISLAGISYLQNTTADFWLWLERVNTATNPKITGAPQEYGAGHYYLYDGAQATPSNHDFFIRVKMMPTTGVEPQSSPQPYTFGLEQNRPNPFNPTTAISYELRAASFVSLNVYDTAGRLVADLVEADQEAGIYQVTFDASKLASGIYLYRLEAGEFTATKKMVLLK